MIAQSLLFSLLSLQTLTSAFTSPAPRALFGNSSPLQIRQSGDETCLGSVCPSGDCIPSGYTCCSDGAGCPIGSDCVPDGCCPTGESCSGSGGGTMTLPGELTAPTLSGFSDLSSAAPSFATPTFGSIDTSALSSFGDAYQSYLATAYSTATGSVKSAISTAQDALSSADGFLSTADDIFSTATGEVPAVVAPTSTNGGARTKEATPTAQSTTRPTSGGSRTGQSQPQSQPASGAEREVSSVWFGGLACAGLVMVMWAL